MDLNEITSIVIKECIYIHKTLGPGLLESTYHTCLVYRLRKYGFDVYTEFPIPVIFEEIHLEYGYRADIVINNSVVIEIKVVEAINQIHKAQVLTYLKTYRNESRFTDQL